MSVMKPASHWDKTVVPYILEQYKGSEKWKGVLKASIKRMQVVENDGIELGQVFDISEKQTGEKLDYITGLINIVRNAGEDDDSLWSRFIAACGSYDAGTPDAIIVASMRLSGDPAPQYTDECPATFFVYTPGGRQLLRKQVRRLAPAGVLGLPGAALSASDGAFLATADGKKILAAARDEDREGA